MADITAIILTKNESRNIEKCITSVKTLVKRIIVVDSGSTDDTVKIAKDNGAEIYVHAFENYARQFNWALDNTNIKTKWALRLDADERFTPDLCERIEKECYLHDDDDVNGFTLEAWLYFMNKKLKYGGSRKRKLMVFKTGFGRIEDRKMDEHTVLSNGRSIHIDEYYLHYDYKDLSTYVSKLNWYATREMQDYCSGKFSDEDMNISADVINKVRVKKAKYYKLPIFFRCWLFYFYAYVIKANFLNGIEGFIYSFLYHLYYRLLVDMKIYEQEKNNLPFEETGDLKI